MTQLNNTFDRPLLADCVPDLVATARGDKKATLVNKNAKLVNVISGEILPNMSIGVQGARIAFVSKDASHMIGPETEVIDADGKYVAPGLIDGHCHIERDRKSTRLNSSHVAISYAVFCLK